MLHKQKKQPSTTFADDASLFHVTLMLIVESTTSFSEYDIIYGNIFWTFRSIINQILFTSPMKPDINLL